MRASLTGQIAIENRTKMHPDEVLELLGSDKVISLGVVDGHEFLFFFSFADAKGKIAIVNEGREVLTSVQDLPCKIPFNLPSSIGELTRVAKKLFHDFLFEKMRATEVGKIEKVKPVKKDELRIKIQIYFGGRNLHTLEVADSLPGKKLTDREEIVLFFREDFQRVVAAVEDCVKSKWKVRYVIFVFDNNTRCYYKGGITMYHNTLLSFLSKP